MRALTKNDLNKIDILAARTNLELKIADGQTALFFAKEPPAAELLLKRGAAINATNERGDTAVARAVLNGAANLAIHLIERGADLGYLSPRKWSLLHIAVANNKADVAAALLSRGTDPNARDQNGESPIFLVRSVEMLDLLVFRFKANINLKSKDNTSPLLSLLETALVVMPPNPEEIALIQRMLALGADVNQRNDQSWSMVELTVKTGQRRSFPDLLAVLLAAKPSLAPENWEDMSALHLADTVAETEMLLAAGASTKALNVKDQTPLQFQQHQENKLRQAQTEARENLGAIDAEIQRIKNQHGAQPSSPAIAATLLSFEKSFQHQKQTLEDIDAGLSEVGRIIAILRNR
jgi:ankyrin repeat protein